MAAIICVPVKVYPSHVTPGSGTGTLYGLVLNSAVPRPIRTMFIANVDSRLMRCARPMTRCTAIQYTSTPKTKPTVIVTGTAPYGGKPVHRAYQHPVNDRSNDAGHLKN